MSVLLYQQRWIKENLRYDPDTGHLWWIRPGKKRNRTKPAGSVRRDGYVVIRVDGVLELGHRVAWFLHYGTWPAGVIDHVNNNPSDNTLNNLRDVSQAVNQLNRKGAQANSQTGLLGISPHAASRKYRVRTNGKYLGLFATLEQAKAAQQAQ